MTRKDLETVIEHLEQEVDAYVASHPFERVAWRLAKGAVLSPERIAKIEGRLIAAGFIDPDPQPAQATPPPATDVPNHDENQDPSRHREQDRSGRSFDLRLRGVPGGGPVPPGWRNR